MSSDITVIGGGLAGCEAAMMLARYGYRVELFEMRPGQTTAAHNTELLGELVCSNSLGSQLPTSASGILKAELSQLGSVVMSCAHAASVPAGRSLGVDRTIFAQRMTQAIVSHPLIEVRYERVDRIPPTGHVIIATGPLTDTGLIADLQQIARTGSLYFYDAISPIVAADSLNFSKMFFGSRYDPNNDDYLNCPLDKGQYEQFVADVLAAELVEPRAFEDFKCFEACLPIEEIARRGPKTLAFGPMKPVGLIDPKCQRRPYAVVQLRRENIPTTMYNLVGFQTRLTWPEQRRIFRTIPGLESAEFCRLGSVHRNTYIEAPKTLQSDLTMKNEPRVFVAGQLCGVEGYIESAAMGLWAGLSGVMHLRHLEVAGPPRVTALGSLISAISSMPLHGKFSPMNMSYGLFPAMDEGSSKRVDKAMRRQHIQQRAIHAFDIWHTQLCQRLAGGPMHDEVKHLSGTKMTEALC